MNGISKVFRTFGNAHSFANVDCGFVVDADDDRSGNDSAWIRPQSADIDRDIMVKRKSLTPVRQQPEAARPVAHSMQVRGISSPSVATLSQIAVGTAAPYDGSSSPPLPPTVAEAFQGLGEAVRLQHAPDGLPEVIETDEPAHGADATSRAEQDSWCDNLEEINRLQAEVAARDAQHAELESIVAALRSEVETAEEQLEASRKATDFYAAQHEHCAMQLTELSSTNSTLVADLAARQVDIESLSKSQYDAMRKATRSDELRLAADTREKQASARLSRTTRDLTAAQEDLDAAQLQVQRLEAELATSITSQEATELITEREAAQRALAQAQSELAALTSKHDAVTRWHRRHAACSDSLPLCKEERESHQQNTGFAKSWIFGVKSRTREIKKWVTVRSCSVKSHAWSQASITAHEIMAPRSVRFGVSELNARSRT